MKRLNFGVVTLTVTLLVAFAFLASVVNRLVPPQEPNALANEEGDYMAMGIHQSLKWQPLDEDAFAEGRRTGKPILLALGAAWSTDAIRSDRVYFADPEVQSYMSRNFVCVRVDLDRHPAYGLVLAPTARIDNPAASNPFTVGFQLVFARPDGHPYRFLAVGSLPDDPAEFLNQLVRARTDFENLPPGETIQDEDRKLLVEDQMSPEPASKYLSQLLGYLDPQRGGFGNSPPTARMNAWLALLVSGQGEAFDIAARPFVHSSLVDWLDGGFFSRAEDVGLRRVQFGKPAIFNADLMHVLALGGHIRENPYYTRLSKNAFDWLTGKAMQGDFVSTARITLANQYGRDARTSIPVRDMRTYMGTGTLEPSEVEWARENLGLRVEDNQSMAIRVQNPAVVDDPMFVRVITKLRKLKADVDLKFTTVPRGDVNAIVLARLAACARLWGDADRLAICRRLFGRLDRFRAGTDIAHIIPFDLKQDRYLGDYVGYAEAALQMYLATGESSFFERGERVLLRADELFKSPTAGIWTPMPYPPDSPIKGIDVPEIVDNMGESLTARMMRLCVSYHRIRPSPQLKLLSDAAYGALNRFSGILPQMGLLGGGLYCSTLFLVDDETAIVRGPGSVGVAAGLYRVSPFRLVAPALPSEMPAPANPEVTIYSAGLPSDPMTPEEAATQLPPYLNAG